MLYCTLAEAKREIKTDQSGSDDLVMTYVTQVSRRIDLLMGLRPGRPFFGPYIEALKFPIDRRHIDSGLNTLLLRRNPRPAPLLAMTTVTADGTDVTSVVEGYPQGDPVFRELRITSSGDPWYSYIDSSDDPAYAVVTGVWGYHSDYANAWLAVDDLAADITASATTFTVANVDGDDPYGFSPRLSRGALAKLDSEYLFITDTAPTTNIATCRRGVLGSTAAAHLSGADVSVWQTEDTIRRVTARQAGLFLARRGAFQVETLDGVGTISYPQDLLAELAATLSTYQYV